MADPGLDADAPRVAVPTDADELYELAPCGYLTTTTDGLVLRVNATLLSWTGFEREELVGRRRFVDLLTPGSRIYHETHYAPLLAMQQGAREISFTVRRRDGSRFPVLVSARVVEGLGPDGAPAVLTSVFEATNRHRYEAELRRVRRRVEEANAHLDRMHRVTLRLSLAGGLDQTAAVTVRSAVEVGGAAVAALWLHDQDRWRTTMLARAAAADVERPAASEPAPHERLGRRAGPDPHLPGADDLVVLPWDRACADLPAVTDVLVSGADGTGASEPRAVVLVPLGNGQDRLGLLACRLDGDDDLDPGDAGALRTMAYQAGMALARARLDDQRRDVAETLQRSLLPGSLPRSRAFTLAHVYEPGQAGTHVGGDWYDAYLLDEDRLAVVVGDVVGRGIIAAATMGQLRSALRALAPGARGPAEMLGGLDHFVEAAPSALCATVVLGVLHLPTRTLTYSCAGHPPPLLLGPAGDVDTLWDGRSLPLGLRPGMEREEAQVQMAPGSTLLMYTDGLVERRDIGLDERIQQLGAVVRGTTAAGGEQRWLEAIRSAMLGSVRGGLDDVCLLGLALHA